jgi:hypothetical protein
MGFGSFVKKIAGVAAPIVGGMVGGPTGAAIGGMVGSAIAGGSEGGFTGGGGATGVVPALSPEERLLLQKQAELVQRFTPIFGDFAAQAIEGKVPISPALEAQLKEREALTIEDIRRRGGPQAEALSTAGIQRLGQFQTGADIAREEARQRAIGLGGELFSRLGTLTAPGVQSAQQKRQLDFLASQQAAAQAREGEAGFTQLLGRGIGGAVLGKQAGIGPLKGAVLGATGLGSQIPTLGGTGGIPSASTGGIVPTLRPLTFGGSFGT